MENQNLIRNLLAISIPEISCLIIFFLPSHFQEFLVLKMNDLNFWSWFTYIFVHENASHLSRNIILYFLSIIFAYILYPKAEKENFYKLFIIVLFLVPLISFIATILIWFFLKIIFLNHRGFSGITSASIGILGFLFAKKIKSFFIMKDKNIIYQFYCFMFLLFLAIIIYSLSKLFFLFILFVTLLIGIVLFFNVRFRKLDLKSKIKFIPVSYVILVILILGLLSLIPSTLQNASGSWTNSMAHLIGFVVGFWIYFILN